ncbi:MAG: alpha/beta fold hydrolase, partial [Planctomycetes bacterium]|nr:alpha/beta fold hydrolase [Planctomycetota bacterium]
EPQGDKAVRGRVERRTYRFEAAGRDQEYALFVPESYRAEAPAPLIVLLHGLGSNPQQVIGYDGITQQAAARGYVVVAPFGYNERGWYGSRGKGKDGPFFGRAEDPDNLGELSEQDVVNVLDIVRRELAIDPDRIYLMGHSMGGSGTLYLGGRYPDVWAGLAPLAPAVDRDTSRLEALRHLPIHLVTGDADRLVRVESVRRWVAVMQQLGIVHDYVELAGGDHVRAIAKNPEMIAGVFDFFDKQRRPRAAAAATEPAETPAPAGTGGK